jgi:hypothetical protein
MRADVRSYRQLERVFENRRFDYVYHLAAEYGRRSMGGGTARITTRTCG